MASAIVINGKAADFLLLLNDAQGRLVERQVFQKINSVSTTLDLKSLPAGMYTVTVSTAEGVATRKISKQ